MVRLSSVHSHVVASLSGHGRTLIDGRAVDWRPGQVLLAPMGRHHAFEIKGNRPWHLAWVFFDDRATAPALRGHQPELIDADAAEFVTLVRQLTREASGPAQPAALDALVTLLAIHTRRLAGADTVDLRLWRLWNHVEADLAQDWSVARLARLACMSEEHLRRLCQKHHQRSPMDHLTHLRLRRAATLLRATPAKLDEVAQLVGYASPYSFSTAFRRWSGLPPARFRRG